MLCNTPIPWGNLGDVSIVGLAGKPVKPTLKGWLKQEVIMDELFGYIMALARVQEIDKELARELQWQNWSYEHKVERLMAEREALLDKYHICDSSYNPGRPATIHITINL